MIRKGFFFHFRGNPWFLFLLYLGRLPNSLGGIRGQHEPMGGDQSDWGRLMYLLLVGLGGLVLGVCFYTPFVLRRSKGSRKEIRCQNDPSPQKSRADIFRRTAGDPDACPKPTFGPFGIPLLMHLLALKGGHL